jgi:hypothetical protein
VTEPAPYDPFPALDALTRHGVRFIIIGMTAGRALGSPTITRDLDICHERSPENLERLAATLSELHAVLRGAPPGLPFRLDAATLARGDSFTFTTDAGDLDILATPAGTAGYEDLARTALSVRLAGVDVLVTSIDDLIRMKRASGRPKDRVELEILGALREELERRGRDL